MISTHERFGGEEGMGRFQVEMTVTNDEDRALAKR